MSFLTAFKTITKICVLTCFSYITINGNFTKTISSANELIPKSRIAERNLLAQGHFKIIPFFPVRHNTLHFISSSNFSSSPSARFYLTFVKTPRMVQYLKYIKFSAVKIFSAFFSQKKFDFWIIKRANAIFLSPVFTVSWEIQNFCCS